MTREHARGYFRRGHHAHRGAQAFVSRPVGRDGEQSMVEIKIIVNEASSRSEHRHGARPMGSRPGRRHPGCRDHGRRDHGRRDHGCRDHGCRDHGCRDHGRRSYGEGEQEEGGRRHGQGHHGQGHHRRRAGGEHGEPRGRRGGWRAEGGRVIGRVIEMPDGSTRIVPSRHRA